MGSHGGGVAKGRENEPSRLRREGSRVVSVGCGRTARNVSSGLPMLAGLLALLASLTILGACSQPASALETREFKSQITTVPVTGPHAEAVALPGKLSGVNSLAVDAGTLYAAEVLEGRGESRIDRFDAASGAFEAQLPQIPGIEGLQNGIAVGHATGTTSIYAGASSSESAEGVVAVLDAEGNLLAKWEGRDTAQGGFGTHGVNAVAAEGSLSGNWASGDVFVADEVNDVVYAFNPTLAGTPGEETAPVAELTEIEPGVKLAFGESPEPAIA